MNKNDSAAPVSDDAVADSWPMPPDDGNWYVNPDSGTVEIDFSGDPSAQLSIGCQRDGKVYFAVYVRDGEFVQTPNGTAMDADGRPAPELIAALKLYANAAAPNPVAGPFDFRTHLHRQREWSERTFGPGARTAGLVGHIRKELIEIEAEPYDVEEWIDVVILALDGAWRSGANPQRIIETIVGKQSKNEGRVWPDWRTAPEGKAIQHVKKCDAWSCDKGTVAIAYDNEAECGKCGGTGFLPDTPPAHPNLAPKRTEIGSKAESAAPVSDVGGGQATTPPPDGPFDAAHRAYSIDYGDNGGTHAAGLRAALDAAFPLLTARVQELEGQLDKLHGAKFSDRCYHALRSRAEKAEREAEKFQRMWFDDSEDAQRYRWLKTASKPEYLLARGAFGLDDAAIDAAQEKAP